MKACVYE